MKTEKRNEFYGYRKVSTFSYLWPFVLFIPLLAIISGILTYLAKPQILEENNGILVIVIPMVIGLVGLLYQHLVFRPSCKTCGKKMKKFRDPDTSVIIFHYCCDECKSFFTNIAYKPTSHTYTPPRSEPVERGQ